MDPEIQGNQHPDYAGELVEIIKSNISPMALKEKVMDYHENDIAAAMELLKKNEESCTAFWIPRPLQTFSNTQRTSPHIWEKSA